MTFSKLVDDAYEELKNTSNFKYLSMDEQGKLCISIATEKLNRRGLEDEI